MPDTPPAIEVDMRTAHREALRYHAIELIQRGHARLDPPSLAGAEEEEITGKLVEAMKYVRESDPEAPEWVEHYEVQEEERVNTDRTGKRRFRIDITVKRSWKIRKEHPRLRFEAKRLKANNRVGPYFGKEGLGCFLRGAYPLSHGEAGMIGYVQAGTLSVWQERLGGYVRRKGKRLRLIAGGGWKDFPCALPHSSETAHRHPHYERLRALHLLLFCH